MPMACNSLLLASVPNNILKSQYRPLPTNSNPQRLFHHGATRKPSYYAADSNEMTSKDEVMRVFKQNGISDQDAKKAFEKVDIDNDDEMPRSG
ncbi:hypothetical protein BDW69DRAFT_188884 [Aspergillus filifer]